MIIVLLLWLLRCFLLILPSPSLVKTVAAIVKLLDQIFVVGDLLLLLSLVLTQCLSKIRKQELGGGAVQVEGSRRHGGCCRLCDGISLNDLMWKLF